MANNLLSFKFAYFFAHLQELQGAHLQEVQGALQLLVDWSLERLRGEKSKLLCVLRDGWDACCATPVEVHVSELVREDLQFVLAESWSVVDDVVGCRSNGSLTDVLRDKEETEIKKINRKIKKHFALKLTHFALEAWCCDRRRFLAWDWWKSNPISWTCECSCVCWRWCKRASVRLRRKWR